MTKSLKVVLVGLTSFVASCNFGNLGPDLTTPLVGLYAVKYQITDVKSRTLVQAGGASPVATMEIKRKNDKKVDVVVTIKDGNIDEVNRFEARVSTKSLSEGTQPLPGLKTINRLDFDSGLTHLYLYEDGKVRGGLGYGNSKGQSVDILINP